MLPLFYFRASLWKFFAQILSLLASQGANLTLYYFSPFDWKAI